MANPREKFTARGHHLSQLAAIQAGNSPEYVANMQAVGVMLMGSIHPDLSNYPADVLGTTEESLTKRQANATEVLRRYQQLPQDANVTIVEGQPDDLCKTCAIGAHCRSKNPYGVDAKDHDAGFVDRLLSLASQEAVALSVEETTTEFSDAPQEQARRISTTVGDLNKIFAAYPNGFKSKTDTSS